MTTKFKVRAETTQAEKVTYFQLQEASDGIQLVIVDEAGNLRSSPFVLVIKPSGLYLNYAVNATVGLPLDAVGRIRVIAS